MAEPATYMVRLSDGREFGPAAMELVVRWAQEGRVPPNARLVASKSGDARSVGDVPELAAVIPSTPPTSPAPATPVPAATAQDSPLSGVIPYRNPAALVGYYLGVFSLIPIMGTLLALPAIILGIVGLVKRHNEPRRRGLVHAWLAIILGVCGPLLMTFGLVALLASR
ncbi:MAG: hypothetical protein ACYSTY_14625 [Planctomycetota bacterium]|jgi:hypothetical protein